MFDWSPLIGLIAIAVAVFFGLWGFRKDISGKLSDIRDKMGAMQVTVDKVWDLASRRFLGETGTVERSLDNLGEVKITAEPGESDTTYFVEIGKPILKGDYLMKLTKETSFAATERKLFGSEPHVIVFSPIRMRIRIPSNDSKRCTEYITLLLRWLDSEYVAALPRLITQFEEPILPLGLCQSSLASAPQTLNRIVQGYFN
ncbi:MAG: hypothetical protein COT13_04495 [Chloroflexi bacterium CG08_land_8_20_14_0_20_45_12]|nr:MAG: hypothetical protein COT13_04495 [Chloroflexi bacterium CG08_land_8_20_14_0_20_45_12]